jgi:cation diffusion facilitator family transporter
MVANLSVALAKIIVGLITQSLAMISDGVHSSLDATNNVIGLVATTIAARPPDSDHPYGHRRFETLATMLIGISLTLTAWEIGKAGVSRLREGTTPEITTISFVVMICTIFINIAVSTYEKRMGKKLNSEILVADSAHTRSDIFVSLTVLASLVATRLGWGWIDAAAALVVVILIGRAAWHVLRPSVDILVDRAALEENVVTGIVQKIPGVHRVARVRSRGPRDEIHLDLDIEIAAPTTAAHSANIAREIRAALRKQFSGLKDIQVYFLPLQDETPLDYALIARAEADPLGLGVHEVIPFTTPLGLGLEMHVEVLPDQTVGEAHSIVSKFEERLRQAIPGLKRVVTHIEPFHTHEDVPLYTPNAHELARSALKIAREVSPKNHWHDIGIRAESDGGYAVSMHCTVDHDMPLDEAHRLAEEVETHVRRELPAIHRVTIHTEPPEEFF